MKVKRHHSWLIDQLIENPEIEKESLKIENAKEFGNVFTGEEAKKGKSKPLPLTPGQEQIFNFNRLIDNLKRDHSDFFNGVHSFADFKHKLDDVLLDATQLKNVQLTVIQDKLTELENAHNKDSNSLLQQATTFNACKYLFDLKLHTLTLEQKETPPRQEKIPELTPEQKEIVDCKKLINELDRDYLSFFKELKQDQSSFYKDLSDIAKFTTKMDEILANVNYGKEDPKQDPKLRKRLFEIKEKITTLQEKYGEKKFEKKQAEIFSNVFTITKNPKKELKIPKINLGLTVGLAFGGTLLVAGVIATGIGAIAAITLGALVVAGIGIAYGIKKYQAKKRLSTLRGKLEKGEADLPEEDQTDHSSNKVEKPQLSSAFIKNIFRNLKPDQKGNQKDQEIEMSERKTSTAKPVASESTDQHIGKNSFLSTPTSPNPYKHDEDEEGEGEKNHPPHFNNK